MLLSEKAKKIKIALEDLISSLNKLINTYRACSYVLSNNNYYGIARSILFYAKAEVKYKELHYMIQDDYMLELSVKNEKPVINNDSDMYGLRIVYHAVKEVLKNIRTVNDIMEVNEYDTLMGVSTGKLRTQIKKFYDYYNKKEMNMNELITKLNDIRNNGDRWEELDDAMSKL